MNTRGQMVCCWGGMAFSVLCLAGFYFAGFIPPISPDLTQQEVGDIYRENTLSMRFAVLLIMTSGGFIAAFAAALAMQLKRIEGEFGPYCAAELGAGSVTSLVFVFSSVFWTAGLFRPERDVEMIRLMNDMGWITMLMTFAPFIVQNFAAAFCILSDKSDTPVFPRWYGFFNFWVGVLFIPGGMLTFFKIGPFAWDGLFVWWVPFMTFFTWYVLGFFMVRSAIKQQEAAG